MKKERKIPAFIYMIFVLYMAALTTMVLFKYRFETGLGSLNFTPFQWIMYPKAMRFTNVFGNIAFFVPFGLLFPLIVRKMNAWKTVAAGFLLSLTFEIIQYVTDTGGADIDDLILNTCGVVLGALFFMLLKRLSQDETKLRRNSLIFVIIFGVIASVIFLVV